MSDADPVQDEINAEQVEDDINADPAPGENDGDAAPDEMDPNFVDEFSSDEEDDFYFETLQHNIDAICAMSDSENSEDEEPLPLQFIDIEGEDSSSDDEDDDPDRIRWKPCEDMVEMPPRIEFKSGERSPGPHVSDDVKEPIDFFKLFFTEEMADLIIEDTNKYGVKRMKEYTPAKCSLWKSWYPLNKEEFWAFIGLVVNMGTVPLATMQEYWATNPVTHIPFFCNTFTRQRFVQIFWMLRPKMPSSETNPRLKLISGFLDTIDTTFLKHYTPNEELYVNESIFNDEGRAKFIRYNPKNNAKYSIRMYTVIDCNTGFICGILPYYGLHSKEKLPRPDLPISTRIPLILYKNLLSRVPEAQGHHMFTDRVFTSISLADELYKLNCHLTGELATNGQRLLKGRLVAAYQRLHNLILAWQDKKEFVLLTNWHDSETNTDFNKSGDPQPGPSKKRIRPKGIANYTKSMVSVSGTYASQYCFANRNFKWWRKLFYWGLEMCLINAYILYRLVKKQRDEDPLKHVLFKKALVSQLRGNFKQPRDRIVQSLTASDEVRLDGKLHLIYSGKKRDCKVCSKRSPSAGRRETNHYCDTCPNKPRMHIGRCFEIFHTKVEFKNVTKKVHKMTAAERKKISGKSGQIYRERKKALEREMLEKERMLEKEKMLEREKMMEKEKRRVTEKNKEKDKKSEKDKKNEKDKKSEKDKKVGKDKKSEKDKKSVKDKKSERDVKSGKYRKSESDKECEKDRKSGKSTGRRKGKKSKRELKSRKYSSSESDGISEPDRWSEYDDDNEQDQWIESDEDSEPESWSKVYGEKSNSKKDEKGGKVTESRRSRRSNRDIETEKDKIKESDEERGEEGTSAKAIESEKEKKSEKHKKKDQSTGSEENQKGEKDKQTEKDTTTDNESGQEPRRARKRHISEEPQKIVVKIPRKHMRH